ncbi:MAG: phosphoribosylformylglycinamidine synthase subunit PurS [Acetobacteraceae bacterium]
MKAIVKVMPKPGVLDPEGKAIARALGHLGFSGLGEVRAGRLIELELTAPDARAAHETAEAMAEALLANAVIETWSVEIA